LTEMGIGEQKKKVTYRKFDGIEADALAAEVETFLSAVLGESNDGVSGEEGKQALSLALQILREMEA